MAQATEIQKAKLALRVTGNSFDSQIGDLLDASAVDLHIAGVEIPEQYGPIVETAKITYVALHFGEPDNYDKLKASYDEQKAQLSTATGYTDWGADNG